MKKRVAVAGVAVLGALVAGLLWPRYGSTPESSSAPAESGSRAASGSPSLSPSSLGGRSVTGPAAATAPSDGRVECEIHVTTFGDPARQVQIQQVDGGNGKMDPTMGTVRVRTRAGESLGLLLYGAAVWDVRIIVPDPVPPRIEVRVPALDDPRLAEPALLVVDAVSGTPLPNALLDPGSQSPDVQPIHADADGRIRVPPALAERLRMNRFLPQSAIVVEREHVPRAWNSLIGMNQGTVADWAEWNATGAMRVRLEPFPTDGPVPRRRLRIVDASGNAREGWLVLMRTPAMDMLMKSPFPARTDATGIVEVVAPAVASYDVYDGAILLGTFVLARDSMSEGGTREIRVPRAVCVHVIVRGLAEPRPNAWLHGPEVVSLDPDESTGWARLEGVVRPGWMAFRRAEGTSVQVSEGQPAEMDIWVPWDVPVVLAVGGRVATVRALEATTVELDWTTLPAAPEEPRGFEWSLTREGLDEAPGPGLSRSGEKDDGK